MLKITEDKGGGQWPAPAPQKFGKRGGGEAQIKVPQWRKRFLVRRKKPTPPPHGEIRFSRGGEHLFLFPPPIAGTHFGPDYELQKQN